MVDDKAQKEEGKTDNTSEEKEEAVETPTEKSKEGNVDKSGSLIDRADEAAKRLKEQNDRKEELLKREEDIEARRRLGGETGGGIEQKPKEESPKDYAKRVMSGEIGKK